MTPPFDRLPLALTMGEPAGIGGEIALKAWARHHHHLPPFFIFDDADRLQQIAASTGLDVAIRPIATPAETSRAFAEGLPVMAQTLARPTRPGKPETANVPAILNAIHQAVAYAANGTVGAIVTNPIHKQSFAAAGVPYPGHTELLAHLAGDTSKPAMLLVAKGLRVAPVTIHEPLRTVATSLTTERIVACGKVVAAGLRQDFAIAHPRIAVAALNPHGGENGVLGQEEDAIIAPAIAALSALGITARGPLPADSLFHAEARKSHDAVLCMYHDQALIPLKTIDFTGGVNVTLGLPFVRTSPDHGTAFDIAGQGIADESSLVAALHLAHDIAKRRRQAGVAP